MKLQIVFTLLFYVVLGTVFFFPTTTYACSGTYRVIYGGCIAAQCGPGMPTIDGTYMSLVKYYDDPSDRDDNYCIQMEYFSSCPAYLPPDPSANNVPSPCSMTCPRSNSDNGDGSCGPPGSGAICAASKSSYDICVLGDRGDPDLSYCQIGVCKFDCSTDYTCKPKLPGQGVGTLSGSQCNTCAYPIKGNVTNNNGTPRGNVTLKLYNSSGTNIATAVTNSSGNYEFAPSAADKIKYGNTYAVRVVSSPPGVPTGYSPKTTTNQWSYRVTSGDDTPLGQASYEQQEMGRNDCAGPDSPAAGTTRTLGRCNFRIDPPPTGSLTNLQVSCPAPGTKAYFSWTAARNAEYLQLRLDNLANPWSTSRTSMNRGDIIEDYIDGNATSYIIPDNRSSNYYFYSRFDGSSWDTVDRTIPGNTYNWWVHARSATANNRTDAPSNFTCATCPGETTQTSSEISAGGSCSYYNSINYTLRWRPVAGATGYDVVVTDSNPSAITATPVSDVNTTGCGYYSSPDICLKDLRLIDHCKPEPGELNECSVKIRVAPGIAYKWRVETKGPSCASGTSTDRTFTVNRCTIPTPTCSVTASPTTGQNVTWSTGGVFGAVIRWSEDVSGTGTSVTTTYSTTGPKTGTVTAQIGDTSSSNRCTTTVNYPSTTISSCTASPSAVTSGDPITFTANASGGNGSSYTYAWTGATRSSSTNTSSSDSATASFTVTSTETKSVSVTSTSGGNTSPSTTCSATVYPALTAPCAATTPAFTSTSGGTTNVVWTATPTGGTGTYQYFWEGSATAGSDTYTKSNNAAGTVTAPTLTVKTTRTVGTSTVVVKSYTASCNNVTVYDPLTVSCAAAPNPATTGQTINWAATPLGGDGTYSSYTWAAGVTPAATPSTTATSSYTSAGTYNTGITVSDGVSTPDATNSCSVTVNWPPVTAACRNGTGATPITSITAGQSITRRGSAGGGSGSYTYAWTVDGTASPATASTTSTTNDKTTPYTAVGTKTASVTVTTAGPAAGATQSRTETCANITVYPETPPTPTTIHTYTAALGDDCIPSAGVVSPYNRFNISWDMTGKYTSVTYVDIDTDQNPANGYWHKAVTGGATSATAPEGFGAMNGAGTLRITPNTRFYTRTYNGSTGLDNGNQNSPYSSFSVEQCFTGSTCQLNPGTPAEIPPGTTVTWTATPIAGGGGTPAATPAFRWSGTDLPVTPPLTGNPITKTYTTTGTKTAGVRITSATNSNNFTNVACTNSVDVVYPAFIQTEQGDVHSNRRITVPSIAPSTAP